MNNYVNPIFLLALFLLMGLGCGDSDSIQTTSQSAETVQGEPIQGALIQGEPIESAVIPDEPIAEVAVSEEAEEKEGPSETVATVETVEVADVVGKADPVDVIVSPEPVETAENPVTEAESSGQVDDQVVSDLASEQTNVGALVTGAVESAIESAVADAPLEVLAPAEDGATGTSPSVPTEVVVLEDGSLDISFDRLASFEYEMPEDLTQAVVGEADGASDQIPKTIRDLNEKSIALKGFMLPLKVEEGLVTEMLIMRDQSMCCYGTVPKINEWVSVKMEGKGVKPVMDQAVTMFGRLKVGEIRENGYLVGIYEMDGDRMDGPTDL